MARATSSGQGELAQAVKTQVAQHHFLIKLDHLCCLTNSSIARARRNASREDGQSGQPFLAPTSFQTTM